jgi:very-short-patch-repair endonuclease
MPPTRSQRDTRGRREAKVLRARQFRHNMTPAKRILWEHLRDHRMSGLHFRRQRVIYGFIADFYCSAAPLMIEMDGPIHNQQQQHYDRERDAILAADGCRILRITNDQIATDLSGVLAIIRAHSQPLS